MIRNFGAGIVWGAVVGVVGLGALSLLTPIPAPPANQPDAPALADGAKTEAPVAPKPADAGVEALPEPAPAATGAAVEPAQEAAAASAEATAPADPPATAPVAAEPANPTTAAPEPAGEAVAMASPEASGPAAETAPAAEAAAEPAPAADVTAAPAQPAATAEAADATEPSAPAGSAMLDETVETAEAAAPTELDAAAEPAITEQPATPPASPNVDAPAAPATPAPGADGATVTADAESLPAPAAAPGGLPVSGGADAVPPAAELPPAAPKEATETLLTPAPGVPKATAPAQIVLDPMPETPAEPANEPTPAPALQPSPELAPVPALPTVDSAGTGSTLAPNSPGLPAVADVAEDRLPQIGDAPATLAEPAPPVDDRPVVAFARPFTNDSGKPAFAIVLRDTGAVDVDRAALAALPFAITFAIDPADPEATAHAEIYRAAGQEVVMLASGIPAGATAGDLEQSFQANATILPEAVAVMDIGANGFQDNRPLASLVVPVVGAQGRGLLTFDKGLNAADQVARRDGVPAAVIFRDLDGEGEDVQKIRRYLDRAAFKAAQEGSVVVVGSTRPETVQAIMAWTVEGRASSVELAPVTAVMGVR